MTKITQPQGQPTQNIVVLTILESKEKVVTLLPDAVVDRATCSGTESTPITLVEFDLFRPEEAKWYNDAIYYLGRAKKKFGTAQK